MINKDWLLSPSEINQKRREWLKLSKTEQIKHHEWFESYLAYSQAEKIYNKIKGLQNISEINKDPCYIKNILEAMTEEK